MMPRSLVHLVLTTISIITGVVAGEAAWNGLAPGGATKPQSFTPYYVPPGSRSYSSSSPLILYTGHWTNSYSSSYVGKSIRLSDDVHAAISFKFTGTGIEWFGNSDPLHGFSDVFIDGKLIQRVNAGNTLRYKQQRIFWKFGLPLARHTIKIVNAGASPGVKRTRVSLNAFVVTHEVPSKRTLSNSKVSSRTEKKFENLKWTLIEKGSTGVNAMQLSIISSTQAIIIDKVQHNPLDIDGHPAWAALYNLNTHAVTPLAMESNSFCAGGTFLSNGTLINVGGNPVVSDHTASADFGDLNGLQSVRIFEPCDSESGENCRMYENHAQIRMASPRWYPTVLRISDGSAMIIGGSKKGGWINNATTNNPTIEFFPPKSIHGSDGLPIHIPFLDDTLKANLFPLAFSLPDGTVFIAANRDAMIYDWKANTERRLPQIPNGVRVTYPMAATAILLPLSPSTGYAPEVLICGGSTVDDTKAGYDISSQDPASAQCSRILLTDDGIRAGWQVEFMPEARTMPDAVLLPTGQIVIVNGAATGISGYGNVKDQVGASNADHPVLTPVVYQSSAAAGQRFTRVGMQTSRIPRMYHSVATLTPTGDIMIAGSNPNLDRSGVQYGTEYRVEWLGPPYIRQQRPKILQGDVKKIKFGQIVEFATEGPSSSDCTVVLMDLGYVTHAVHANSRMVYLEATVLGQRLQIKGPPNGNIYPPGPGWLYLVVNGVPSEGIKVLVGSGKGPEIDEEARKNLLEQSDPDQYEHNKGNKA